MATPSPVAASDPPSVPAPAAGSASSSRRAPGCPPTTALAWFLVLFGVVLAAAGVTPRVDSVAWFVFGIVDGIPWTPGALLAPVFNPPPMETFAHRPLSTILLKLALDTWGRSPGALALSTFLHGLVLVAYGLAARAFVGAHGASPRTAAAVAVLAMCTPSVLFSAWTLPEFDALGAAVLLAVGTWHRQNRWALTFIGMVVAVLVKETTGVLLVGLMIAATQWSGRKRAQTWRAPILAAFLLVAATWQVLVLRPKAGHAFSVASTDFDPTRAGLLVVHALAQLFHVCGPIGAALIAWRAAGHRRWVALPLGAALVATPVLRVHNHYEAVTYAEVEWVVAWALVLLLALGRIAVHSEPGCRVLARFVLISMAALVAGPLLVPAARADLSARLLAPIVPALLALALPAGTGPTLPRGPATAVWALGSALLGWHALAGGLNAVLELHARARAEDPIRQELATSLRPPCPIVLTTNRYHELYPEELAARADLDPTLLACTRLVRLAITDTGPAGFWEHPLALQGFDQARRVTGPEGPDGLREALRGGTPLQADLFVLFQGPRARFSAPRSHADARAFEWATTRMPDIDRGYFQQSWGLIFEADTPLERYFRTRAQGWSEVGTGYVQLPVHLLDLPHRAFLGLPFLERYTYRATLYKVLRG